MTPRFLWALIASQLAIAFAKAADYVDLESISGRIPCSEKILVVREKTPSQYILPPSPYFINDFVIARDVFAKVQDNFDFFMIYPHRIFAGDFNIPVHRIERGLGAEESQSENRFKGIAERIKSTIVVSAHSSFKSTQANPSFTSAVKHTTLVNLHELGHHWCCTAKGFYQNEDKVLPAHFPFGMELFGKDSLTMDPLSYMTWIQQEEKQFFCAWTASQNVSRKFSELTQYLMGIRAPEEVRPIRTHYWDTLKYGNMGPSCAYQPEFIGSKEVTIQDIIRLNGPRVPSHTQAKRVFNVLPLVLVPYGDILDTTFISHMDSLLDTLPKAWESATDGRSQLRLGCDLDLATKPIKSSFAGGQWSFVPRERVIRLYLGESKSRRVSVELRDLAGRLSIRLFQGQVSAGILLLPVDDGSRVRTPPGVYSVNVVADGKRHVGRIVVSP